MSRSEMDGWLAALCRLNGNTPGKKNTSTTTIKKYKSRRKKRNKGKPRNGR